MSKLWGGGFDKKPKEKAVLFAAGRDVKELPMADSILIPYEIKASKAWVKMLFEQELINQVEKNKLLDGLDLLEDKYNKGELKLDPVLEDVQTNIEAFLTELLGEEIAGKIHTGRSRTEQAIVEIILYLKEFNDQYKLKVMELIKCLEGSSIKYKDALIPGYTHHQRATVTTLGRVFDCYGKEFEKDLKRFEMWNLIEEVSPLGSAAGYGSSLPVDKIKMNKHLGLKKVFDNEIQAIAFKGDAECQMVFNLAMFMNHISSLAQTLIMFSTKEFGFVKISDEFCTGSSIMPQKKNPDSLEVMKAKAAMCHGYLMSLLSMMKGSFIGYNRDMQWSKYAVMDAITEIELVPEIMAGVVDSLEFDDKKAKSDLSGFILAQPIMEGLIMDYKIPMRIAKIVVEQTVKISEEKIVLSDLNKVLKENKLDSQVSQTDFNEWTNLNTIIKNQHK